MTKSDNLGEKEIVETKSENNLSIESNSSKPTNKWMIVACVLGVIAVILLILLISDKTGLTGNVVNENDMKARITAFLNNELLPDGGAVLKSLDKESGVYVALVTASGQDVPLYFTYDGNFISPGRELYKLSSNFSVTSTDVPSAPKNVTKSDKPLVQLFVMTHCPYGTQAEKGFLPVMDLLKDKANLQINFVHYFMHGDKEEEETYRQICIRQDQSTKFNTYLTCFLEAGDSAGCLTKAGIDTTKLKTCMDTNAKKYYEMDSQASKAYGVQGSPTLVINGVQADFYPRSPANALDVICSAFNTEPSVCSTSTLSTANPSPGFGSGTTSASTDASCG
ncbi:MAG TPA: hypothetical protein P5277_04505 [Candidatus Paceibacterota bacterium]|nr:hypothetical protein [Candidatus Paceibacterota bacterium]